MNRTNSITLGDSYQEFTQSLLDSGRYNTLSEIVRAGLSLLEVHEAERAKEIRFWELVEEGRNSKVLTRDEALARRAESRAAIHAKLGISE